MRLDVFLMVGLLIAGLSVGFGFGGLYESYRALSESFTIDGGKSVYRCREITK